MAGPGNLFLNIPVQVQGVSGISQAVNTSTATMIPAALAVLPAGTLLRGNIAGRDANGNSILKTEKGDILLKTDYFLKRDTELMIKLEIAKDEMFAKIVTIDGKSVSRYLESQGASQPEEEVIISSRPLTQQLSQPLPPATSAIPASQPGMIYPQLKAILLSPNQHAALPPQLPPEIAQVIKNTQPGIQLQLTLKIVDIVFPNTQSEPQQHSIPATTNTSPSTAQTATTQTATTTYTPAVNATAGQSQQAPSPLTPPTLPNAASPLPYPASNASVSTQTPMNISTAPPPASTVAITTNTVPISPSTVPMDLLNSTPSAINKEGMINIAAQQITSQTNPLPTATTSVNPTITAAAPTPPIPQTPAPTIQIPSPNPVLHNPLNYTHVSQSATPTPLLEAQVMAQDRTGSITAQTSLGLTRIFAPQQLPQGTRLFFEISAATPVITTESTTAGIANNTSSLARLASFDALSHLTYPAALFPPGTPPIHLLPHTDNDLGTELFMLLSALKGGDFKKWVQSQPRFEVDKLGEELLQKLQSDFSALRTVAVDSRDGTNWNLYNLPLYVGLGIEQIKFFHRGPRKEPNGDNSPKREETGHFIFDISFSALGRMQFDGLLQRPKQNELHFDLAIRSDRPLADQIRQDIRNIYISAQEISGFLGGISFFAGKDACRNFDSPRPAEDHSSIIA